MKVTKLVYQKQDPNRVNIFIDNKFAAGLETNDIIKLNLFKDKEISPDELKKIVADSEFGKLFNCALNFLSFRPRSEWEMRRKLKFKSQNSKLIEQVVEKLKQINQINDTQFAIWFADQRTTFKPKSQKMIFWELRRLGVNQKPEIKKDDLALAKAALGKRSMDKPKAQRFLASRGFDWDTISELTKN